MKPHNDLLSVASKHYAEMAPHVRKRKTAVLLKCLIEQNKIIRVISSKRNDVLDEAIEAVKAMERPLYGHLLTDAIKAIKELKALITIM